MPASFGALLWRLEDALGLSLIVKATFSLEGSPMRPTSAEPIYHRDVVHAEHGSLVAPNDLVPRKPKVDVVAWGRAARPGGQEGAIDVRLGVQQIAHMAIDRVSARQPGEPSGFGPIGFTAPTRHPLLSALRQGGDGALVIPASLDPAVFQSAPNGQQIDALARDATVVLDGMHPTRARVVAALPSAMAEGVVFGTTRGGGPTELVFRADTLVIHAERMVCSVVWRAEVALIAAAQIPDLLVVAGVATTEHRLTLPRVRPDGGQLNAPIDATVAVLTGGDHPLMGTAMVSPEAVRRDLPFAKGAAKVPAALAWAEKMGHQANKGGTAMASAAAPKSTPLPFGAPPGAAPPVRAPAEPRGGNRLAAWAAAVEGKKETLGPASKPRSDDTLPFGKKGGKTPPQPAARAWVEASGNAKGGTAAVFGNRAAAGDDADPLPFGSERRAREAALAELDAKRAADAARIALAERERAAAAARALEEKAACAKELAERRRAEEKERFEAEQRRLRELEAERKRRAQIDAEQEAEALEDDLYGGFAPKK